MKMTDPHATQSTSLWWMARTTWSNRDLLAQMIQRDIVGRYKGAAMGLAWSFVTPLLMLAVYTFVFSVVFKARWHGDPNESKVMFALVMFVGMLVHGVFAEVVNRSPTLIVSNPNYVKKIVFPIELLPVVAMGSAIFHMLVSSCVFVIALLALNGRVEWTSIFLPLVLAPLVIFTLGTSWFLSSLGVYLRDVGQVTAIATTVLLFLAPVFYPVSALPADYQWVILANPLTLIIEQARAVLIAGRLPDFASIGLHFAGSLLVAWLGFAWFQKTRKGFADVI